MTQSFAPGDDLVFQLESGLGLLRVIAVEGEGVETVWHLLAYDEFFLMWNRRSERWPILSRSKFAMRTWR